MKSLSLTKPHMIIVVGIAGAGKSFFAEQFSDTFQAPLVSDTIIAESLAPLQPTVKTKQAITTHIVSHQIKELLKTKQSLIIDASCDTRSERTELTRLAKHGGYEPLVVWVQTEPATAKLRSIRPQRGNMTPRMTAEEHDAAVRRFTIPNASEKTIVISGKHTYATQAKIVLTKLAKARADTTPHPKAPARKPLGSRITIR